jgi:hypothetical protein
MAKWTGVPKSDKTSNSTHPSDRVDRYYVSYCSKKGYKNARQKAGILESPAHGCSYRCCWFTRELKKAQIDTFPRYLRRGFEYGAESHGFKKHGDPNRKKASWAKKA